jgi:hypothetical protein
VLAHWNNNPQVDMLPHSDTLSWFWANQSLLFLLNTVYLVEKQQIQSLESLVLPDWGSNPRSTTLEESMLTIIPLMRFLYARLKTGRIMWLGMAGGRPHRFPHNNFSSVYRIFTELGHMIPLWKGKNPIYFGVIRSKVTYYK